MDSMKAGAAGIKRSSGPADPADFYFEYGCQNIDIEKPSVVVDQFKHICNLETGW